MSPAPKTVDEYLAALPDDQRAALEKTRETIKGAAPEAVEAISYGIPGYKLNGKPLIHFGAAKNHCPLRRGRRGLRQGRIGGLRHVQGHHPLLGR